jgi:hypothetical protein
MHVHPVLLRIAEASHLTDNGVVYARRFVPFAAELGAECKNMAVWGDQIVLKHANDFDAADLPA